MKCNKPLNEIGISDPKILAYIAGFFDAEGFITIRKNPHDKSNITLRCGITQKDRTPLDMIALYYGGCIYQKHRIMNNKLYECWGWGITTRYVLRFLKDIVNYAIGKKSQIEIAIRYQEGMVSNRVACVTDKERSDRNKQRDLLRRLNKSKVVQLEFDRNKSNEMQGVLI